MNPPLDGDFREPRGDAVEQQTSSMLLWLCL